MFAHQRSAYKKRTVTKDSEASPFDPLWKGAATKFFTTERRLHTYSFLGSPPPTEVLARVVHGLLHPTKHSPISPWPAPPKEDKRGNGRAGHHPHHRNAMAKRRGTAPSGQVWVSSASNRVTTTGKIGLGTGLRTLQPKKVIEKPAAARVELKPKDSIWDADDDLADLLSTKQQSAASAASLKSRAPRTPPRKPSRTNIETSPVVQELFSIYDPTRSPGNGRSARPAKAPKADLLDIIGGDSDEDDSEDMNLLVTPANTSKRVAAPTFKSPSTEMTSLTLSTDGASEGLIDLTAEENPKSRKMPATVEQKRESKEWSWYTPDDRMAAKGATLAVSPVSSKSVVKKTANTVSKTLHSFFQSPQQR